MRILIVDDHDAIRRSLRSLLSSRAGWVVCGEAADGFDAIDKARALRPDLVLMDISMPRMNGLDATRVLRKEIPEAKVVIVSQNHPDVVSLQSREVNAAGYVTKSALSADLLPTLDRLFSAGQRNDTLGKKSAATAPAGFHWLAGGGTLGERICEQDWSRTPLGPIEGWPQSLKTAVNLMLNSRHPMWIGWGPEMTFLYNDAYISVLSLAKHPNCLGRPAREVWAEIWDICGPLADKVFLKGEATFLDDVRLFMSRGEFLEETYYSFSYSPIHDESGGVGGLFCPSTETTPKVLNARRLRTLSDLAAKALLERSTAAACASCFATLAENPDDIPFALLYLLDADGRHVSCEQSTGLSKGIGRVSPPRIDLESDSFESQFWKVKQAVGAGQSQIVSLAGLDSLPTGLAGQRMREAITLPVTSRRQDRPVGVLIAGVNPTRKLDPEYQTFYELLAGQVATAIGNARAAEEDRKRAEALAELDRAKTVFFSNISHEFRTPLALMLGPVEDLLSRSHTDLPPAAKNQLEMVNRNGSRLLRLVNTLLDFSRIEAGRMQVVYQPTDLSAFTIELAGVFRSATEKGGLRLELDCPKLAEPVFVDRDMWEKIVLNLISNAFKFTFEGEIAVSVARAANAAELRVRDTGVGIPASELSRLFDRFHRVQNTRSRTHEGSGIGLALLQELVRLHGGSVRVESVAGEGSTFVVSIPLGSAHLPSDKIGGARSLASTAVGAAPFLEEALGWLPDARASAPVGEFPLRPELIPVPCPPVAQQSALSPARPRILIADDNADMRQYLVRLLAERYDVVAFANGQAAFESAQQQPPDLVLTDVMMPELDGFGLLRELRQDAKTASVPIILVSARAGEEARVEGVERGADDYLIKPFSARELLARVQTHLELARVRRQSQEVLRQRTAQFETLLDAAPLGVYLVDADFRLQQVNPTARLSFGDIPDLIGRDFGEVIGVVWPKPYADEITQRFRHTLETGEPYIVPERAEHRADRGVREIYEWQINRIPLTDGRFGVVCYFRDISHLVKAREAIAQSEHRLRLATQAAELGIWYWYPHELQATWENDRVYEIYGRTRQDGPLSSDEFMKMVHPEDVGALQRAFVHARETRGRFFWQGRFYRKDRVLRWLELTGQAENSADGSLSRVLGTVLDITERKESEERERHITAEALAATAKFRAVFEQTPVFAGIMSLEGVVIDANQLCLKACGYRAEEVLGRPFWETGWWRKSKDTQEKIRTATAQAAQGTPYQEVLTYHFADGTERVVDFALHPIVDNQGRILFLHPTGVDITDLKRAEENYRSLAETLEVQVRTRTNELEERNAEVLKQSEQLRDLSYRLMQTQDEERRHIARELHDSAGQILTALGMNLSLLSRQAQKESPQLMKHAAEAEDLLRELSQEIRTTSYLLHPPLLDDSGLAEALLWYIRGLRDRSGLQINLTIPEDFGRLSRDMELVMFRIVQECLTNVHRHSGSKIATIGIARDGENVRLEVTDEGRGIAPEKLIQLQARGAGVGIRGMRERVLQLGGEMHIRSAARGTSISIQLPLPPEAAKTSPSRPAEYRAQAQSAD